jgi:hypothetical protein
MDHGEGSLWIAEQIDQGGNPVEGRLNRRFGAAAEDLPLSLAQGGVVGHASRLLGSGGR